MIPWSLSLTSPPAAKPLTVQRVLDHCRIDLTQPGCDIDTVESWIDSATEQAELLTGRQLIQATFELRLDAFPCGFIPIPKPPLSSVTHVKYYAPGEAALSTLSSSWYIVDAPSGPKAQNGRIVLASGYSWPGTEPRPGAVIVTFVAGYGTSASSVPASIKDGMLLKISRRNETREDGKEETGASERLWSGFVTYMPELR